MSGAAGKREVTIAECLALPDDSRFELIDGELVEKASPTFEHGLAQAATVAAVRSARGWWIATEVDIVLDGRGYRPDTVTKLRRYHQAGVPHYWIVDQVDRTLTVHRHLPEGLPRRASRNIGRTRARRAIRCRRGPDRHPRRRRPRRVGGRPLIEAWQARKRRRK